MSKLKLTSSEAMKIAEKLYLDGYISYPRTETNSFDKKFNFKNIISKLEKNHSY